GGSRWKSMLCDGGFRPTRGNITGGVMTTSVATKVSSSEAAAGQQQQQTKSDEMYQGTDLKGQTALLQQLSFACNKVPPSGWL
ncbi:hypothetical protein, partial [Agrobacterium sp.]|uniref:hypothetical protein n=1 Tax=Agrobacterium sp. TaxID=361 RepID=UPI004033714E